MTADSSWDVVPVANPDLPARKRNKLFHRAILKDPAGVAAPVFQWQDREHVVAPSSLDHLSRELLARAQQAIAIATDADSAAIGPYREPRAVGLRGHSRCHAQTYSRLQP